MDYLKKHPREAIAALAIIILYFLSRFFNILALPIFTDEAIYVRWAQYIQTDLKFWDYSITDGKQPLFIWLMTIAMYFFTDPLMAGRFVSVCAGFATLIGMFFLTRELFKNRWMGLIAGFLYAIYPFALVYDRMALYDSLVGTFAVWGLYCIVLLIRYIRLRNAVMLGVVAGLATVNKTNGFFNIYLLPFTILLFDWSGKKKKQRVIRLTCYVLLATIITYALYNLLRLSPYFHIIEQKNATFVYPFSEWIKHPFEFFWGNLAVGQRDWFVRYFGYPFTVLVLGSFLVKRQFLREKLLLVIWFAAPFLALALFGNTLYPRYIFFMTLSLLPLVAYSFYHGFFIIKNRFIYALVVAAVLIIPIQASYEIVTDFANAPIPVSDVGQYNNDWPAGTGIKESIAFLRKREDGKKMTLYTQGTFGLMPYAYEIYLHDDPQFIIKGIWPINDFLPDELNESAKRMPTYIVFYQPCTVCPQKGKAPAAWRMEEVFEVKKISKDTTLTVYQVVAQ